MQLPSIVTIVTPVLPAAFSAWLAPSAAGSLIVYTTLMSLFADRQFSIAVFPPGIAPWVGWWQAIT